MSANRTREADVMIGNTIGPRSRSKISRLLTDPQFAIRAARFALGLPTRMETEDRRVLEKVIFPYYTASSDIRSVLFVGCDWYTRHYSKSFSKHDYWTIDVAPQARLYGARQHIVDALEHLDDHVPVERFDLIICNGVFGFGLNTEAQCERALNNCFTRLKRNGHFLFGWTDVPSRVAVPLTAISQLDRFQRFKFPEFNSWRYVTNTPYRHTYDFYTKPG